MSAPAPPPGKPNPEKFVDADDSTLKTFASRQEYEAYCRAHGLPVHPPPDQPPAAGGMTRPGGRSS